MKYLVSRVDEDGVEILIGLCEGATTEMILSHAGSRLVRWFHARAPGWRKANKSEAEIKALFDAEVAAEATRYKVVAAA